jgi:hypothetical protein
MRSSACCPRAPMTRAFVSASPWSTRRRAAPATPSAPLQAYLERSEDEGNAWGRLGALLARQGRAEEARAAYRRGIEQATKHGHPSMAAELEAALEEM